MSMDPGVKEKFLKALRSGKYEQGTNCLRTRDDKYCCLGVYCEVVGLEWDEHPQGDRYTVCGCSSMIPSEHHHQFARSDSGNHSSYCCTLLAEMNDNGTPFNEIADWIEEKL